MKNNDQQQQQGKIEKTDIQLLKKENNKLKRDLIEDAYTYIPYYYNEEETEEEGTEEEKDYIKDTTTSYLDLACGRGGDIDKIWKANYSRLIGIDINNDALEDEYGYRKRFESRKQYFTSDSTCYQSDVSVNSLTSIIGNTIYFDTIGIQYALHYFFKNERSLDNLLLNVQSVLKTGGLFIGIGLDGERVKNLYMRNKTKNIKDTLYQITPENEDLFINNNKTYGNQYTFNILGTDETNKTKTYFEKYNESVEYKTSIPLLTEKTTEYSFDILKLKHVYNNDKEQVVLQNNKQSYEDIIYLNFIFIFQKKINNNEK